MTTQKATILQSGETAIVARILNLEFRVHSVTWSAYLALDTMLPEEEPSTFPEAFRGMIYHAAAHALFRAARLGMFKELRK